MNDFEFTMVSEWMENGTINNFLGVNPDADKLRFVRSLFRLPSSLLCDYERLDDFSSWWT